MLFSSREHFRGVVGFEIKAKDFSFEVKAMDFKVCPRRLQLGWSHFDILKKKGNTESAECNEAKRYVDDNQQLRLWLVGSELGKTSTDTVVQSKPCKTSGK